MGKLNMRRKFIRVRFCFVFQGRMNVWVVKNNNFTSIYKEGPHSALCDEEFYDAVETGLDKIDEDNQLRDRLKQKAVAIRQAPESCASTHRLWPEVQNDDGDTC